MQRRRTIQHERLSCSAAYQIDSMLQREPQASIRLSQKGSALLGLHRYKEAEDIYRQISTKLKAIGDYHSYAIALNRLGMSLLCQERQQEAIPYYREAASLFSKMGDLYNEIHSHKGLYLQYRRKRLIPEEQTEISEWYV